MKTKRFFFLIAMIAYSLSATNLYSQTVLPGYKDTSQTITKEELFLKKAQNKKLLKKKNDTEKVNKSSAKVIQRKKEEALKDSTVSKKDSRNERKTQNARRDAGSNAQKAYVARDKANN